MLRRAINRNQVVFAPGNAALGLPSDHSADGEGLCRAALESIDVFQQFGRVLDDRLCVLLEVGGGEQVHGVEGRRVEEEDAPLVLSDGLAVEDVEPVHPAHYLQANLFQPRHPRALPVHLVPELQLRLEDLVDLEGEHLRAAIVLEGKGVLVMISVGAVLVPHHCFDPGLAAHVAHQRDVVGWPPLAQEVQRVDYLIVFQQKGHVVFVEHRASRVPEAPEGVLVELPQEVLRLSAELLVAAEAVQAFTSPRMEDYLGAGPVGVGCALLDQLEVVGSEAFRTDFSRIGVPQSINAVLNYCLR